MQMDDPQQNLHRIIPYSILDPRQNRDIDIRDLAEYIDRKRDLGRQAFSLD